MRARASPSLVSQEQLLPFLLNPNSYPRRPRAVQLIQTHASLVFLAPPYVFKVKKPVNFGFLDFSTLAKRRYFCEREVALNRRLCPRVYLGVVPIARRDGHFAFGGDGEAVEYAVQMRRLPERGFLLHRLRRGQLGRAVLDRLVMVLKGFYEEQHPTAEIEEWGRVVRLKISTDENFRQTRSYVGKTLTPAAFNAIRAFTNGFFQSNRELFSRRIRERWIRDCHGDLHLDHIHAGLKELHVYDCIEFNDRFRYVDVANDVAFLAMDLDFHHRPDLAAHFAERIARALKDRDLPRLLDFYKCYRAYVRGKVESLHSSAATAPEAERREAAESARRYFQLALRYAVAGSRPLALLVMGRIASGKSTLAAALGEELGWPVASSDRVRKERAGFPLHERSEAAARARLYSPAMTRQTYSALLTAAVRHAAAGESCVLDATFGNVALRRQAIRRLRCRGVRFVFVESLATAASQRRRLMARDRVSGEVSDARLEDRHRLNAAYAPPRELSATERVMVCNDGAIGGAVNDCLAKLVRLRLQL